MLNYGCCTDKLLPYSQMNDPVPKLNDAHYKEAEQRKIVKYARASGLSDIKLALANGHLLMGCLLVGDNFAFHVGNEVIGIPSGMTHGYHAVIVCGYSDKLKALRIANSWGEKRWGDNGFAWLSYDYLNNALYWPEAWVVEVRQSAEDFYPDRIFRDLRRWYLKKKLNGGVNMIYEKAFWVALIGVLVPILNHFFQLGLDVGEIVAIALPIIALILGVSWKEAEVAKAELAVQAEMIKAGLYEEVEE